METTEYNLSKKLGTYDPDKHGNMICCQLGEWLHIADVENLLRDYDPNPWRIYPEQKPDEDCPYNVVFWNGNYWAIRVLHTLCDTLTFLKKHQPPTILIPAVNYFKWRKIELPDPLKE